MAAAAFVAGSPSRVEAIPFTITSVLTGDFRANNPDNLIVNVTVTGDTTSNVTSWVIDINSPLHPNARLDVFAFNLALSTGVTFSGFAPTGWSVTGGTNVPGSGGADFLFESNDPPRAGNNVTNSTNLSFNATLTSGTWNESMFFSAPLSAGGGIPAPGAQMGAHLQSLSTAGCTGCSDSGFASGNYSRVPEPTTLLLLGMGLIGVTFVRRRSRA